MVAEENAAGENLKDIRTSRLVGQSGNKKRFAQMKITEFSVMEMSEVERTADGLPKAWPIFRAGENIVTRRDSMPVNLELSQEDLQSIAAYQRAKGTKIPIDCQHVVSNLAGKLGLDEPELLKRLPRYSGVAGFGNLEARDGALYLTDAEWLPIGSEVMKAGQYRYFSPTIRGLDGKSPLRVRSVALTNNPCLQHCADLAASEDEEVTPEEVRAAQENIIKHKEADMPEELKTEAAVAAPAAPEPEKKADEELLAILKEVLGDDVTPENLKVTLAALKTKAEATEELSEKVRALELSEQARREREERHFRKEAEENGFRRGVLTPADLEKPYIKNMSAAELSEYCNSLPDGCKVPVKTLELSETEGSQRRAERANLTDVQKAIYASTQNAKNMKG